MPKIIIASGPVIVENNKVLLDQQGVDEFWKFCGGKIQDQETLIETARRRAKEEMGIDIEILNPEPFFLHTQKETTEGAINVILVHFLARRIGNINPGTEIRRWDWLDLEKLAQENLGPNILPALKHFGFIK